jgi:hypothetical protein
MNRNFMLGKCIRPAALVNGFMLVLATGSCGEKVSERLVRINSTQAAINIQHNTCIADSNQQYSFFLPDHPLAEKSMPVIYAFDPHGDGSLAVNLLAPAASKLGYLVIGSNNFRNGSTDLEYICNSLFNDTKQRFRIDPGRIYLIGFSGGARAAASIALSRGDICGLIVAGAGLPGMERAKLSGWPDIYCMAGQGDFNMNEILATDKVLSAASVAHTTRIFPGKHEWPPAGELEEALLCMELNAMQRKLVPRDSRFIDWYYARADSIANAEALDNQPLAALDTWKGAIAALQELTSVNALQNEVVRLQQTDNWKQANLQQNKLTQLEENVQREYARAFESQEPAWWKNELDALNAKCTAENNPAKLGMYNRLKGFLGVAAFSFTAQAVNAGDTRKAEKLIAIYQMIEPGNPDCLYYQALLYDKQGKTSLAVEKLKESVAKGLSDKGKINRDFSKAVLDLIN